MGVIENKQGKNIVVCCDGTRAKYSSEEKNTNVVRLFERLGPDGPNQISYYDPGAGTYSPMWTPAGQWLAKGLESASGIGLTGTGIRQNIAEAYRYLMAYYEPGDQVFLFGYSRGAHTVRTLAGMLFRCGLLTRGSQNLIPYMAEIYRRGENDVAEDFKGRFSRHCRIHFIGVWDTVASVGYFRQRRFSDNALNPEVRYGFQALAMHERRYFFQPSIWDKPVEGQTIEQVWFPGCHGDVGGQDAYRGISDIPLKWMMARAEACGLKFNHDLPLNLQYDPTGAIKQSDQHIWRLGAEDRPIAEKSEIHESVLERIDALQDSPSNMPSMYSVVRG